MGSGGAAASHRILGIPLALEKPSWEKQLWGSALNILSSSLSKPLKNFPPHFSSNKIGISWMLQVNVISAQHRKQFLFTRTLFFGLNFYLQMVPGMNPCSHLLMPSYCLLLTLCNFLHKSKAAQLHAWTTSHLLCFAVYFTQGWPRRPPCVNLHPAEAPSLPALSSFW